MKGNKMKYLALTEKGTIHDVGDCGDWEAANEVLEDIGLDFFYLTTLDNWVEIANTILNNEKIQNNSELMINDPDDGSWVGR